jgi:drug/metabolite transporter (DMT)-like permease
MHVVRTLFALFAMATLYYALADIPVAQAIALTFLIPLFTTIAAGLVLRESVGIHRWGATLVGFAGAMVIIRPGVIDIDLPIMLVVLSSALYAGAWSSVKILTRTDSPAVTVFWLNVLMVPLTAIPAAFLWVSAGLVGCLAADGDGVVGLVRPFLPGAGLRTFRCQRRDAV